TTTSGNHFGFGPHLHRAASPRVVALHLAGRQPRLLQEAREFLCMLNKHLSWLDTLQNYHLGFGPHLHRAASPRVVALHLAGRQPRLLQEACSLPVLIATMTGLGQIRGGRGGGLGFDIAVAGEAVTLQNYHLGFGPHLHRAASPKHIQITSWRQQKNCSAGRQPQLLQEACSLPV
ncbi:hypothetical protein ACJX0J_017118, partial [Zea mays]